MDWRERIVVDPAVCHGRACIRGTRVLVSVLLDNLGAGETAEAIARDYDVTVADVRAALQYAGELTREQVVALPDDACAVKR
jgi:uncharacterized protein (DUF433 family)